MTSLHGRSVSLLMCLIVAGCGGGGGGGSNGGGSNEEESPFTNAYAGVFNAPATGDSGTADVEIGADGTVSGTLFSSTRNAEGPINGSITSAGAFTGTMQIAGLPEATLTGLLSLQPDGHLSGTLQATANGTSGDVTFDLVPKV